MPKQYKSEALAAAHETAQGLADAGVMAKRTMRAFDEMCLTPVEDMSPEKIRALRLRENASQAVIRAPSERDHGLGEPVGAGRETPPRRLPQAPDASGEARPERGGLRVGRDASSIDLHARRAPSPSCGKGQVTILCVHTALK